jgi:hypothetical protein
MKIIIIEKLSGKLFKIMLIAVMNKSAIRMNLILNRFPEGLFTKLYIEEISLINAIKIKGRVSPEKNEIINRALMKV